jgi:DNA-binding transcriptional MerR regulator
MTKQHYLLNQVARLVGVKAHKIHYAISNGYLAEPVERINDKRIFTEKDVATIKAYFAGKPKRRTRHAKA